MALALKNRKKSVELYHFDTNIKTESISVSNMRHLYSPFFATRGQNYIIDDTKGVFYKCIILIQKNEVLYKRLF